MSSAQKNARNNIVDVYGIKTCTTVKKALAWLVEAGLEVQFHDYKKEGITANQLALWDEALGWRALLNKSGTTFRNLPQARKTLLDSTDDNFVCRAEALALMAEFPSLVRRPLIMWQGRYLLRFSPESYAAFFGMKTL